MPPVMMTKVMPIARKALSATCLDISTRLAAERKFGAANEKNISTANSAMNVRSRIRLRVSEPPDGLGGRLSSGGGHESAPCPRRRRPLEMADGRRGDDLGFGGVGAIEQGCQPPLAHHRNAVGKRQRFVEIGSHENDAKPLRGEFAHQAEDFRLCSDVDASARLVHEQNLRFRQQRLADHDFLLVSAGERRDGQSGVGDLDRQVLHLAPDDLGLERETGCGSTA